MTTQLPLQGIRVLDASRLLPGPYATLVLADLGAEVLKIEDTGIGDYIRAMPPHVGDIGAYFASLNRNKQSVSLNLKHPEGKAAFLDMVKDAHIVVESFRPGVMSKLGLDYEACKAVNPAIVFCSITGYGHDTPYRERAGHDLNYLATAGVLGINGSHPEQGPVLSGAQMADIAGGSLFSVISILAALRRAEQTGEGAFVDASMTDGALSLITMVLGADMVQRQLGQEVTPEPGAGTMQLNGRFVCYNVYKAADGYVSLGALEPKFWMAFCQAVERPDLASAQFSEATDGASDYETVKAIFLARTRAEWQELNTRFDFCGEPILQLHEVPQNEHIQHRKLMFDLQTPAGAIPQVAVPVAFEGATRTDHTLPPVLAESTERVLQELGWSAERIAAAAAEGAVKLPE